MQNYRSLNIAYSYFGAWYYGNDLSVLPRKLSGVDPLADKYPSMSPYMYVGGHPVMLVDPDGRKIFIFTKDGQKLKYKEGELYQHRLLFGWKKYEGDDEFAINKKNQLNFLKHSNCEYDNAINILENDKKSHKIIYTKGGHFTVSGSKTYGNRKRIDRLIKKAKRGKKLGSTIYMDNDNSLSGLIIFALELKHSLDLNNGKMNFSRISYISFDGTSKAYLPMYEIDAINFENIIRNILFPISNCNNKRLCYPVKFKQTEEVPIPENLLK